MVGTDADRSWMDGIEGIDQGTVESPRQEFPYVQWVHGGRKFKQLGLQSVLYTGGVAIPVDAAPYDDLSGWARGTLSHHDETETAAWVRRDVTLAILWLRRCWEISTAGGRKRFAYDDYAAARALATPQNWASSKLHVLGFVRDLPEEMQPAFLTLHGTAAKAFMEVLARFRRCVIDPANMVARGRASGRGVQRWPYRAFWLTVGPAREADGTPQYTSVGKGANSTFVTLPAAIGLADKPSDDELRSRYVGTDLLLQTLNPLRAETEDWAHAWDRERLARAEGSGGTQWASAPPAEYDAAPEAEEGLPVSEEIPF